MNYRPTGGTPRRRKAAAPTGSFPTGTFLAYLAQLGAERRIEGYRHDFTPRQRTIFVAHYPDEVPLVNDEYEHIALSCADIAG
ncbi:MAG TPA: hypothetical protein VH299_14620 [Solirubrobacterales bacterium]|jgi:hypothetical protein|nr:hypothetical protein [Solirubrobacterales bacterium]